MKTLINVIVLSVLATACIDLGYDQPQPVGTSDITTFPEDLVGTFANKSDTLIISSELIISGHDSTKLVFSDSVKLRSMDGWYFLNLIDGDRSYWSVVCAKRKGNKLQLMIPEIAEEDKALLEKKWEVKEYYNSLENLQAYVISPDQSDWKMLLKSKFYTKVSFKKID